MFVRVQCCMLGRLINAIMLPTVLLRQIKKFPQTTLTVV